LRSAPYSSQQRESLELNPSAAGAGALQGIGWTLKRQSGSHRVLPREGWPDYVFAFQDSEEVGPKMLARIGRQTGLSPDDI
jgi:predicted RNA binding protein YcfA (HicA-like mRNA interferase family)